MLQSHSGTNISSHVLSELISPELRPCLRYGRVPAALMSVPKTSMDKYTGLELGHYNVRISGQVSPMDTESNTVSMKIFSYEQFRFCVLPTDAGHHF